VNVVEDDTFLRFEVSKEGASGDIDFIGYLIDRRRLETLLKKEV
jgi:hypothetical protein